MSTNENMTLVVNVKGEILKSNFPDFQERAETFIESINYDLSTDEDFGQASLDVKQLGEFEKALDEGQDAILRELDDVYSVLEGCKKLKSLSTEKRLKLSKDIKAKREDVINGIVSDGVAGITDHGEHFRAVLLSATKGKKKLDTMKEAVSEQVVAINDRIAESRVIIERFKSDHGESIAYNESKLLVSDPKEVESELETRLERKRADEEKARLKAESDRLRAEMEAAKKAQAVDPTEVKSEPAPLPEPRKVDPIKVGGMPADADASREWEEFKQSCVAAFAPVKAARLSLRHPENIVRAQSFAETLGAAWKEVTK